MVAYIDDNKESLEITKEYFRDHGIDIDIFESPFEFPYSKVNDYKVIISDYDMPINGQEFLNSLPLDKNLKTIIYSGKMENVKYANSLQVDAFLVKPFDSKRLISTVKLFLNAKK